MKYFSKTYHTPGTSPGTLIGSDEITKTEAIIRLINYTHSEHLEKEVNTTDECLDYINKDSTTWIHIQGQVKADTIKNLGDIFKLHPLSLEDVLNIGQRPKVEEYDDMLFVILSMPIAVNGVISIEQVSIFLGKNYIISFCTGNFDPFELLRNRLQRIASSIRSKKADYLLYCIMDLVIDHGYPVLETIGENIEKTEEELLSTNTERITLGQIHHMRRELLLLRRNLWPQREVINTLLRSDNALITDDTSIYFRDCYDHIIQILELLENYREMGASLIDIYLSFASQRLNEVMRILTMIATIFIPLTFIVGLYGMNFSNKNSPWAMPELHWYYGYPIVWAIMIIVTIAMVIYFKRKDWF